MNNIANKCVLNRIVHCKLCNEEGKHSVIVGEHIQTCPSLSLECPNKCNEKLKRKDIEEHRKECPLEEVDCPFKEAGCEVRLPRKDISEHEASSMQSHLRLNMKATAAVKRENNKLKGDLDTILSVVSTGLSSMDIPPNDRKAMDGIRTILTSLTSMIQPDGKTHCIYMSNKLGIFRDSELGNLPSFLSSLLQASSPALCIYPGFKIYLAFGINMFLLLLEKSDIHGYPKTLFIKVQPTTGRLFSSYTLNNFKCLLNMRITSGREIRLIAGNTIPGISFSNYFYMNIMITDIS